MPGDDYESSSHEQVDDQLESSQITKDDDHHDHRDDNCEASITIIEGDEAETRRYNNGSTEIHRVCLPPSLPTVEKLKHELFEIFFPDDPLSGFKNRTGWEKVCLGVQSLLHVFHWMPRYNFKLFRSDLIAGITISSLAIPQVYIHIYIYMYIVP